MNYQTALQYLAYSAFSVAFVYIFTTNRWRTEDKQEKLDEDEEEIRRATEERIKFRRLHIISTPMVIQKDPEPETVDSDNEEPLDESLQDPPPEDLGYTNTTSPQRFSPKDSPKPVRLKDSTSSSSSSLYASTADEINSVTSSLGYEEDDTIVLKPKKTTVVEDFNSTYEFKKEFEKEVMGHRKSSSIGSITSSTDSVSSRGHRRRNSDRVLDTSSYHLEDSLHNYHMYHDTDYTAKYKDEVFAEREVENGYYVGPNDRNDMKVGYTNHSVVKKPVSFVSQIPIINSAPVVPTINLAPVSENSLHSSNSMNDEDDSDEEDLQNDWNVRFQSVIKGIRLFSPSTPLRDRIKGNLKLLHLAKDFIYTAQMYGKVIISEAYLHPDEKTIKPASKLGILGGEKYITHGILFKFAVDHKGLFGSDYAAAKVAGHELKGLISYFNCGLEDLNVPLMCLVDYRGFRLIAISVLPIDQSTIIYGTCDAGKSIHASDKHFNKMMKKAAVKLNIQPHRVRNEILYSPADLEGHMGKDKRYYLLDFSRVFPPEAPITSVQNAHLSRLLRPEFVMSYSSTPLCSDAFSGFIKGFHEKANKDVAEATEWLLRVLIPKFARGELTSLMKEARGQGMLDSFRLTETIHSRGVNCRYLGLIRRHIEEPEFRFIILIEILARVIKNNLRLKLRLKMQSLKRPLEEPYRRLLIKYLNLIFGDSAESEAYWNDKLKLDIKRNFIMALTQEECEPSYSLKYKDKHGKPDVNFLELLLQRLAKMTGMRFAPRVQNPNIFHNDQPLNETDLETLPLKVKHMNIVSTAEGFYYSLKGLTTRVQDPQSAQKFYMTAIDKFEEALDSNPNNKELLLNVALTWTLALEDEFTASGNTFPASHPAVSKATEYYLRAISTNPKYDSHSLFLYAYFLELCGNYEAAEDYYLQSLESDPNNASCLLQYGNLLSTMGLHNDAEQFYKRASENTKGLKTMEWDYWGSPRSRELQTPASPRGAVKERKIEKKRPKSNKR